MKHLHSLSYTLIGIVFLLLASSMIPPPPVDISLRPFLLYLSGVIFLATGALMGLLADNHDELVKFNKRNN